tara:strand:- start:250 stop:483 length:234 start_codon:yes stop_codon:yes gene_type:complete
MALVTFELSNLKYLIAAGESIMGKEYHPNSAKPSSYHQPIRAQFHYYPSLKSWYAPCKTRSKAAVAQKSIEIRLIWA